MDARRLSDRYDVEETIGRGGMADVVAATDSRLGRRVAVKILRDDLARDPSFVRRFESEALAAARLNHPGIVSVFDVGEHQPDTRGGLPRPFIVMEKVDGSTLRTVLDTEGPLPPARAVAVAADVLDALAYSHEQGVVHNDIKPGNVMITDEGAVKIMDFGIARALADMTVTLTQPDHVLGTAKYMAPELTSGRPAEPSADVYAVGCVLFEMLTGSTPFTGDPAALVTQHLQVAPPRVSSRVEGMPAELDDLVASMLAKDPADRPATALDAEASLREITRRSSGPRPSTSVTGSATGHGASSAWGAGAAGAGAAGAGAAAASGGGFEPLDVEDRPQEATRELPAFRSLDEAPPAAGRPTAAESSDQADDSIPTEGEEHVDHEEPAGSPAPVGGAGSTGGTGQAQADRTATDDTVAMGAAATTPPPGGSTPSRQKDPHAPWQPGDDVPAFAVDEPPTHPTPVPPVGSTTDVSGSTTGSLPAHSDVIRLADTSQMRQADDDGDEDRSRGTAVAGSTAKGAAGAAGVAGAGAAAAASHETERTTHGESTDQADGGTTVSGTTRLGESAEETGGASSANSTEPVTGTFSRRSRRGGLPWWAWALGGLALSGAAVGTVAGVQNWSSERGSVSLPDVRGKSQQEAEEILHDAGLEVRIGGRIDDAPLGTVLEQTPDPGTSVERGAMITLVVASTENTPVPSGSSDTTSSSDGGQESDEGSAESSPDGTDSSTGDGKSRSSSENENESPEATSGETDESRGGTGGVPQDGTGSEDEDGGATDEQPTGTTRGDDGTTDDGGENTGEAPNQDLPTDTGDDPTTTEPDPTTTEPDPTTTEPDPTTSEPSESESDTEPSTSESESEPSDSESDTTTSGSDSPTESESASEPSGSESESETSEPEPSPTDSQPEPTSSTSSDPSSSTS
ncbi:protein kinase domain-containing protein [Kytococcus sp. Marseille-QA3725]